MDVALLTAFATPLMAMLAMLWHQQRSILKQLGEIGERLARIEGYLGIGMPPSAAAGAAGASLVADRARTEDKPDEPSVKPAEGDSAESNPQAR